MKDRYSRLVAAGAFFTGALGWSGPALASESIFPYLPGTTIGIPLGALPPPGLYFGQQFNYFDYDLHNGCGKSTPVKIHEFNESTSLLWVPGWTFLGADYGASFIQPYRFENTAGVPIIGHGSAGAFINPVLMPLNLSWNLGKGWRVSTQASFYPPAYSWKTGSPNLVPITNAINTGRNYASFEPGFAVSYLEGGWNLTVHGVFDVNDTNPANNYHSGTTFLMDYTAMKKIGIFDVGLGGTVIQQLEADTQNGRVVAATPVSSRGNIGSAVSIGPSVGFEIEKFLDFPKVHVLLQWFDWVEARNTVGGNQTWIKFDLPLSAPGPMEPAKK
jgi:hypothetical protein